MSWNLRRSMWALAGLAMVFAAHGCADDASSPPPAPVAAPPVVAPAASQPPPKEPGRFGVDAHGRLKTAAALVAGFEVPLGLKLVRSTPSFLEFEIRASLEELREHYEGVDRRTGRRFALRGYAIEGGRNGILVRHTSESVDRLDLEDRFEAGQVFLTGGRGRSSAVRIHKPRPATGRETAPMPFEPQLADPEPLPTARAPRPARDSGYVSSTPKAPVTGRANPNRTVGSGRTASSRPDPADRIVPGTNQPERHGWHRSDASVNLRPALRKWKADNPGKGFID